MRIGPVVAVLCAICVFALPAFAATYYVRSDGGSETQCTGTTNAAYPGSGSNQACAWDHPFRALPPTGSARISGGDTLIIVSSASGYKMGYSAAWETAGLCESTATEQCHMQPVPSGSSSSAPTRILGADYAACTTKTQLWGAADPDFIINLDGSSNVEIQCIEITDHSSCVESQQGTSLNCDNDTSGNWATVGMYAEDSTNVLLKNLDIHGLANTGIHAGRLTNWTLDTVRIAANGWVGWDGDIGEPAQGENPVLDDSNSGTLKFSKVTIEWNGCGETYPDKSVTNCWGQTAGGYGDGLGTGATGGTWIFEDCVFQYNTSDGLDLLYARPGSSIQIRRCISRGNAGNPYKTNGPAAIENSIAIADCSFHQGKSFTYDISVCDDAGLNCVTQNSVDPCRAGGNAIEMDLFPGNTATVTNCTITGEGDVLVNTTCAGGQTCTGAEKVTLRNNIFVGNDQYEYPPTSTPDTTAQLYSEQYPGNPFDADYSLVYGVKETSQYGAHDLFNTAPGVVSSTLSTFDARLTSSSAAINHGTTTGAPTTDYAGNTRDGQPDIGAYEYTSTSQVPANLVATGASAQIDLTWSGCSGASSYEIERMSAGPLAGTFAFLGTSATVSYSDTSVSTSAAYAYRVRAVFSGGTKSSYSNADLATTYSFSTIAAGTTASATHVSQLRQAIASARTAAGLSAYTWTDFVLTPSSTTIRRIHVVDLRTALDAVLAQLGMSALTYTDSTITAGSTKIKAAHFTELQNGVK